MRINQPKLPISSPLSPSLNHILEDEDYDPFLLPVVTSTPELTAPLTEGVSPKQSPSSAADFEVAKSREPVFPRCDACGDNTHSGKMMKMPPCGVSDSYTTRATMQTFRGRTGCGMLVMLLILCTSCLGLGHPWACKVCDVHGAGHFVRDWGSSMARRPWEHQVAQTDTGDGTALIKPIPTDSASDIQTVVLRIDHVAWVSSLSSLLQC